MFNDDQQILYGLLLFVAIQAAWWAFWQSEFMKMLRTYM